MSRWWLLAAVISLATACSDSAHPTPSPTPTATPSLASGEGLVVGRLLAVGGIDGAPDPQRGTVYVRSDGRIVKTVTVAQSGRYEFGLAAGNYTLDGRSPQYRVNGKLGECQAIERLTVRPQQSVRSNVYCQRR